MQPHVCFAALPAFGHLYPLMPLAQAFADAGARVDVATGEPFLGRLPVPTVRGVEHSALGFGADTFARFPAVRADMGTRWVPAFFGVVQAQAAMSELRGAWEADRPDLVVYETTNAGARVVADDLGIPAAMFGIGHYWPPMNALPAIARRSLTHPETQPWEPVGEEATPPATYLDTFPPSLQLGPVFEVDDHLFLRTVAWEDPSTPPLDLTRPEGGRPLIYVTLGTVQSGQVEVLRDAILEASTVGDVLVAAGPGRDPGALGELPAGVTVHDFVPQASVLRVADLVVHHGGSGTTLAAAAAGVPQLVIPQGADQFANAKAVPRAGIGLALAKDARAAGDVTAALERLRDEPAFRTKAAEVAAEIAAEPGPDAVAAALLARL